MLSRTSISCLLAAALLACTPQDRTSPPASPLTPPAPVVDAAPSASAPSAPAPSTAPKAAEPGATASASARCSTAVACAKEVARALESRDMAALAAIVHPKKGVRFSPYAYVDASADVVVPSSDLAALFASKRARRWGSFDGSGDPITLTFAAYLARFAADHEFSEATNVGLNKDISGGNTTNNAREVYPKADIVELYLPPRDEAGMDWAALRLVFENDGTTPYLIGVIHSEWTI